MTVEEAIKQLQSLPEQQRKLALMLDCPHCGHAQELAVMLRKYGWHQPYCKRADLDDDMRRDVECNCGLSDARRRAVLTPAAPKEAPDEH